MQCLITIHILYSNNIIVYICINKLLQRASITTYMYYNVLRNRNTIYLFIFLYLVECVSRISLASFSGDGITRKDVTWKNVMNKINENCLQAILHHFLLCLLLYILSLHRRSKCLHVIRYTIMYANPQNIFNF